MRSGQRRLILEVGKKRRVVAGAMDWPGLDRWETSEDDAIAKLLLYVPRYVGVAGRAGLAASSSAELPITSWIMRGRSRTGRPEKRQPPATLGTGQGCALPMAGM